MSSRFSTDPFRWRISCNRVIPVLLVAVTLMVGGCWTERPSTPSEISIGMLAADAEIQMKRQGAEEQLLAMRPPLAIDGSELLMKSFEVAENTVVCFTFADAKGAQVSSISICEQMQEPVGKRDWVEIERYEFNPK